MNNLMENPWAVLVGAIMVLIGGTLMVNEAANIFIFSSLLLFLGKTCIAVGITFTVLALYFLRI